MFCDKAEADVGFGLRLFGAWLAQTHCGRFTLDFPRHLTTD